MTRKKKAPTPAQPSNTLPLSPTAPPVAPVALLIDGENVVVPDLIAHVLVEAGKMGGVTIRQVYGNWAAPSMQPWKKYTAHYSLEQLGNRSGRNATDIALTIGAMDLFYSGIKHFCLVAGDSDYVPLVLRLRQSKCQVLGIGTTAISAALKEACTSFISTDQLLPNEIAAAHAPSKAQSPAKVSVPRTALKMPEIVSIFIAAYYAASSENKTEWIALSALGITLRQLYPAFEQNFGKKQLSTRIKEYPTFFEVRQIQVGKGQKIETRLRT